MWIHCLGTVSLLLPFGLNARPLAQGCACESAAIDSVITNGPLCPGDPVDLAVVVSGDVIGYSWEGPGTGTFFTFDPAFSFGTQVLGQYMVVAYGMCGNDTAVVEMTAQGAGAGQDDTLHICDDAPPRVLADLLGTHAEGGAWTFNGAPHSGIFNPAADQPGQYVYTSPFPVTCPGAAQTATITVAEIAIGPDSGLTVCATDPAFALSQGLSPGADPGGTWSRLVFLSLVPHGGMYDPAVDSSGFFRYTVGACWATVQVTEDPAFPWFADADGDSLGDPATRVWACTAPPGYVADSTDNCILLPGRVGSPCDDGSAATVNDQITDSCTCAGSAPALIVAAGRGLPPAIWPNPFTGGSLFVGVPGASATVQVFNAMGAAVTAVVPVPQGGVAKLELGGVLARGMYLVRWMGDGVGGAWPLLVH